MPGPFDAAGAAQTTLIEAAHALVDFDNLAKTGSLPADFVRDQRGSLRASVAAADQATRTAFAEAQAAEIQRAATLRAQAEADLDATTRLANINEHAALVASPASADDLAAQAQAMLAAGRPERAALLLEAARSKGLRGGPLEGAVSDALDESNATRKEARAIEDGLATKASEFASNRFRILAASGLGVAEDGSTGTGAPGQAAAASVGAKVAAYAEGKTEFPVGRGRKRGRERRALPRARPLRHAVMSALAHDHAATMIANPDWDFVASPSSAIGHASVSAAEAYKQDRALGRGSGPRWRCGSCRRQRSTGRRSTTGRSSSGWRRRSG